MARKGRAGPALGVSAIGSFVAGTISVMGLVFIAPPLAEIALTFGPPEYFSLMVMALTIVTYLARFSIIKALMMALFGLFLSTVGLDPIVATGRFVFGVMTLYDGIPMVAALMGLFGVSEVLENMSKIEKTEIYKGKIENIYGTREDLRRSAKPIVRGSLIGFFMGIFPGVGSIVPTLISYIIEKRLSKHPEKFGTGEIEGVASAEACNNAAVGGTFIPMMVFGIPSSPMTALILAAIMIFGLHPGPLLLQEAPDLFWGVIASMYIGNAMLLVLNLPLIPLWVKILRVPYSYLFPLILLFCLIGAYSISNNPVDITIMISFGFLGYVLREFRYELAPLVLAFVIGPIMEAAFRRSLVLSGGSFMIFLARPISATFLTIAFIALILPVISRKRLGSGLEMEA